MEDEAAPAGGATPQPGGEQFSFRASAKGEHRAEPVERETNGEDEEMAVEAEDQGKAAPPADGIIWSSRSIIAGVSNIFVCLMILRRYPTGPFTI